MTTADNVTTETQPTPGPWTNEAGMIVAPDGEVVCQLWSKREEDYENAEANGRLIAAAPDLLEALKAMDDLIEKLWGAVPWGKTFNLPVAELNAAPLQAKRAIAKAEGKK